MVGYYRIMNVYISDIEYAVIFFIIAAFLLTVPYMIRQYRKLGSVPVYLTLITFSFIFYILCAYSLVLLPLPDDRSIFIASCQYPRVIPFNSFSDLVPIATSDMAFGPKVLAMATNSSVYQYLFNILLLLPLGMYLRYWMGASMKKAVLICFAVSFSFEFLQFTGILGLYEHPYRTADIDDLIANTFGGWLGFMICGPIMKALPTLSDVKERARLAGLRATTTRRTLSIMLDFFIVEFVISLFAVIGYTLIAPLAGQMGWTNLDGTAESLLFPVTFAAAFGLIPFLTKGQTPGQKIVGIYTALPDGTPAPWYRCLGRYISLYIVTMLPIYMIYIVMLIYRNTGGLDNILFKFMYDHEFEIVCLILLAIFAWFVIMTVRIIVAWRKKTSLLLLHGLISGTRVYSLAAYKQSQEQLRDAPQPLDADASSSSSESTVKTA